MNHTTKHVRKLLIAALSVGALTLGATAAAQAARFGVRVIGDDGEPVAGASVCVGLHGNYRQFGTAFTDLDGVASLVEVPNVPFVVTISKTRFAAVRMEQPAIGYNLVRDVTLTTGLPGPRCKADSTVAANPPVIEVRTVDVVGETAGTTLTPSVTGEPNHYRLADNADFLGSTWQRFERSITLPSALGNGAEVYLQMRRFEGATNSWVEARSEVVTISLPN